MSEGLFKSPDDATPLTPDEQRDLIPAHIAFRRELNEAEQENFALAQDWALARRGDLLTEKFVRDMHKRMLGDVWRWAGKFRASERNLGVPFYAIPAALRQLLDEARAWIEYRSFPPDEVAVRFHHRLVQIHPFTGYFGQAYGNFLIPTLGFFLCPVTTIAYCARESSPNSDVHEFACMRFSRSGLDHGDQAAAGIRRGAPTGASRSLSRRAAENPGQK
jgi:Fic-DOC domain mobile mystery protein B